MKLLSVIMPAYNAAESIGCAIESIIKQEYSNFELIIIDDGSSDRTVQVIKGYADIDSRIKLVEQAKNEGVAAARNRGLELASGEYIAFVDADDRINSSMYVRLIKAIEDNKCDLSFCKIVYEYEKAGSRCVEKWFVDVKEGVLSDSEYKEIIHGIVDSEKYFFAGIMRYVFVKEILSEVRFDVRLRYREDMVFLFEILAVRKKACFLDFEGYCYVRRGTSSVERYNDNMFEQMMYAANRIFKIARAGKLLQQPEKMYALKVMEAASQSISNLYRLDAPYRKRADCIDKIIYFTKEIHKADDVRLIDCGIKYGLLKFLTKIKAYWIIHFLYCGKERHRQRNL